MNFIDAYLDIPLDGVMLDEWKNWAVIPTWQLFYRLGDMRYRRYSKHLTKELERRTGEPVELTLLHMRHARQGRPEVRMKASSSAEITSVRTMICAPRASASRAFRTTRRESSIQQSEYS